LGLWDIYDFNLPGWREEWRSPALLTVMSLGALAGFFKDTGTVCHASLRLSIVVSSGPHKEWVHVSVLVPVSGGDTEARARTEIERFRAEVDIFINTSIAAGRAAPIHRRKIDFYDRVHREFQAAVRIEEECAPPIFGVDGNLILVSEGQGYSQRQFVLDPIRRT
jgi:hypothetical protein